MDLPRLVAACDKSYLRDLVSKLAPQCIGEIDWNLQGRELGQSVQQAIIRLSRVWGKFHQIYSLARHGNTATVRSVLYHNRQLRDEFDELCCSSETAAVWLALKDDELFEYGLSALHADKGLDKRSWKAFRVRLEKSATFAFERDRLDKFETLVRDAIRVCDAFDAPGELETHHFRRTVFPEFTHSRTELDQVTVYAEARLVADEAFENSRVETRVRSKVDSISVVFDIKRRELDVVTLGGGGFISDVANAFFASFSNEEPPLEPLIRRKINFERLLQKPDLPLKDQTRFVRAKVDEIRVRSPGGTLYTIDAKRHRDSEADVYDCARTDFGDRSPFERYGWSVLSARIMLFLAPSKPGRKPPARAVELKSNGRTNLREQVDEDLYVADELLRRWGILEADEVDDVEDRDPTSLVCSLLAYSGLDIAAHQLATAGELVSFIDAGWLFPVDRPSAVPCQVCDITHSVDVTDLDGRPQAICMHTAESFEVMQTDHFYRVDGLAVARSLASALQLEGDVRGVKGTVGLWTLGTRTLGDTRAKFFLTPEFDRLDAATSVMDAAAQQSSAMRSALIVANDHLDHIRLMTQRIKVISLRDIAKVDASAQFSIDEAFVLSIVVPEAVSARGLGRPPRQRDRIFPILNELEHERGGITSANEICNVVAERFQNRYPGTKVPVRNAIRSAINSWLSDSKRC